MGKCDIQDWQEEIVHSEDRECNWKASKDQAISRRGDYLEPFFLKFFCGNKELSDKLGYPPLGDEQFTVG